MNLFYKGYCRVYQFIFKCAIPVLPYRKPKILENVESIPADLKEIVKEEDLDFLSESAFADACRPGNPRDTSVEEIKELYLSLM